MKKCAVYIMTNRGRRVLSIGATHNLAARVEAHKRGDVPGFAQKYHCDVFVYAEFCDDWDTAIRRERQLKKWKREWKRTLISQSNPTWRDLSDEIG